MEEPDWDKLLQQLRSTVPFQVVVYLGQAKEQDINNLLDAMNEYNRATGGRGLEFIELHRTISKDGEIVRALAACPAVPDNEVS